MRRVWISQLNAGEQLAKDIINDKGNVLLASGTILTEFYIELLRQYNVGFVYIITRNAGQSSVESNKALMQIENVINPAIRLKLMYAAQNAFVGRKSLKTYFPELVCCVKYVADQLMRCDNAFIYLQQLSAKNDYLYMHSVDVCIYSMIIGKALCLTPDEISILGLGGILHDIGKLDVPGIILDKPGKLTEDEFDVVKQHTIEGYQLLRQEPEYDHRIILMVLQHHERSDGSGYPWGINEEQIHSLSRIVAVADVYDAVTTDRVYRDHMSPYEAMQIINDGRAEKFSSQVVDAFNRVCVPFNIGSTVELENGTHGVVVRINTLNPARPVLRTKRGVIDLLVRPDIVIRQAL